jgi:hypothetical protein
MKTTTTTNSGWKTYKVVTKDSTDIVEVKARSVAELLKKVDNVSWAQIDGVLCYTAPEAPTDSPEPTFTPDAWGQAAREAYIQSRSDEAEAIANLRADQAEELAGDVLAESEMEPVDNPLGWTPEELEEIRNEVFGSCTHVDECYTLPELQAELTWFPKWDDGGKEVPTPYRTKAKAIKSLLSTEISLIRYQDTGGDPKVLAERNGWIRQIKARVAEFLSRNKLAMAHAPKPKLTITAHQCLCGCGTDIFGKSLFKQGHDAKVARVVRLLEKGKIDVELVSQPMLDLYWLWVSNGRPGGTAHPRFVS